MVSRGKRATSVNKPASPPAITGTPIEGVGRTRTVCCSIPSIGTTRRFSGETEKKMRHNTN